MNHFVLLLVFNGDTENPIYVSATSPLRFTALIDEARLYSEAEYPNRQGLEMMTSYSHNVALKDPAYASNPLFKRGTFSFASKVLEGVCA